MFAFTANEYTIYQHLKNREVLPDPHLPFCSHWLYSKVTNQQRQDKVSLMSEAAFEKAMTGLVEKGVLKKAYDDRYYFVDVSVTTK